MTIWVLIPIILTTMGMGPLELLVWYLSGSANIGAGTTSTYWRGYVFYNADKHKVHSDKLYLYRGGTPGTVTISIRAVSGILPTGPDLVAGTTDGNTLTTSPGGEWREILYDSAYTLQAGQYYAVCIRPAGPGNIYVKGYRWSYSSSNGNARYSPDSGVSWGVYKVSGKRVDFWFEHWGRKL